MRLNLNFIYVHLKLEKKLDLFSQLFPASQLVALRHGNLDKRIYLITLFFTMILCVYVKYVRYIACAWSKRFSCLDSSFYFISLFSVFVFGYNNDSIPKCLCVMCDIWNQFITMWRMWNTDSCWHFAILLTLGMHNIALFALVNFLLQQLFPTPILKNS